MTISAFDFIFDGILITVCTTWLTLFAKTIPWVSPPPTQVVYPIKDMAAQIGLIIGIVNIVINVVGVWFYGYSQ